MLITDICSLPQFLTPDTCVDDLLWSNTVLLVHHRFSNWRDVKTVGFYCNGGYLHVASILTKNILTLGFISYFYKRGFFCKQQVCFSFAKQMLFSINWSCNILLWWSLESRSQSSHESRDPFLRVTVLVSTSACLGH